MYRSAAGGAIALVSSTMVSLRKRGRPSMNRKSTPHPAPERAHVSRKVALRATPSAVGVERMSTNSSLSEADSGIAAGSSGRHRPREKRTSRYCTLLLTQVLFFILFHGLT